MFHRPTQPQINCDIGPAAENTTDASLLGTTQIPDGPWVDQLPTSWRMHMNTQLNALGCDDRMRVRSGGKAGLWATPRASKTVPLDQGSVSGIMQHVSDESVRQQVHNLALLC